VISSSETANSSSSHWTKSISRQRTTPWIAGIGPIQIYGEVLNLFNSRDKDIAYWYQSYIPSFDAAPVEGRLSRVVEPRTLRIGMKVNF
jgi:hypothetical protein